MAATAAGEEAHDEELSELEDDEAEMYLHTPEEAKLKELIWTELNKDFLERQSAKAAALESAAAKVGALGHCHHLHLALTILVMRITMFLIISFPFFKSWSSHICLLCLLSLFPAFLLCSTAS